MVSTLTVITNIIFRTRKLFVWLGGGINKLEIWPMAGSGATELMVDNIMMQVPAAECTPPTPNTVLSSITLDDFSSSKTLIDFNDAETNIPYHPFDDGGVSVSFVDLVGSFAYDVTGAGARPNVCDYVDGRPPGATGNDENGSNSGHVRVYDYNGSTWTQLGLDIDGEADNDWSGNSVAMSADGTRIAIGAYGNDGNGVNSGHVRVYDYDGTNWIQVGGDVDGEAAGDNSGWSVAMSADGTRIAIGAQFNGGNGVESGHVRVYKLIGTTWHRLGGDIDGAAAGDKLGWSVAMSADGTRIAIGAPLFDGVQQRLRW